jgi:PTS system mannose-specific IIA component
MVEIYTTAILTFLRNGDLPLHIFIISHANLSKAMLESAEMIMGEQKNVYTFGLYPGEETDDLKKRVDEKICELPEGEEVLVLSDLFYGSPFNAMVSLLNEHKFHHITGINLPILLEILIERGMNSENIYEDIMCKSKETIIDVNQYLKVDF